MRGCPVSGVVSGCCLSGSDVSGGAVDAHGEGDRGDEGGAASAGL